jgi:hypothetical protein
MGPQRFTKRVCDVSASLQMALAQDVASVESRGTAHSMARVAEMRHRLKALQDQVCAARGVVVVVESV